MANEPKTHVVVTIYIAPKGTMVVNVYGPYTWNQAKYERKKTMKEYGDKVTAFVRRTIDIDAMNQETERARQAASNVLG